MPSIGNNIPILTGAGNYAVPDRYMAALRANVRFFVLRYPKYVYTDQRIMGPFDCRCSEENVPGVDRASFDLQWLTGPSAGITFLIQSEGHAIAHMPDDVYFHNRILLLSNPWMLTASEGILTREGTISATQLHTEVQCLREYICEPRTIYKVMRENGNEVTFRWTREEAQKIIDCVELRTLSKNSVPINWKPYERCYIEESKKVYYKPRFESMINTYKRQPYGWTACPEFRKEVIPAVDAMVKRRLAGERQSPIGADIEALVNNKVRQVLEEIEKGKSVAAFANSSLVASPQDAPMPSPQMPGTTSLAPVREPQPTGPVTYSKNKLHPLKKTELREIALKMGIAIGDDVTKDDVIGAILSKQEENAPVIR